MPMLQTLAVIWLFHLLSHCVLCHAEEVPDYEQHLGDKLFEISAEQSRAMFGDYVCPQYETLAARHSVIYERQYNRFARNILELRAWKARRAIDLLQVRCSSQPIMSSYTWEFSGIFSRCRRTNLTKSNSKIWPAAAVYSLVAPMLIPLACHVLSWWVALKCDMTYMARDYLLCAPLSWGELLYKLFRWEGNACQSGMKMLWKTQQAGSQG